MSPSKVIRVAEDVWRELQRQAIPLEDDANSVLRRVLSLPEPGSRDSSVGQDTELDERIAKVMSLVAERIGQHPDILPTTRGRRYRFIARSGTTVAYLLYQRRLTRIRIATGQKLAEKAGLDPAVWAEERPKGWFNTDTTVRFFIGDDEDTQYDQGADVLSALWRL